MQWTLISWYLGLALPNLWWRDMPSEDLVIFVFAPIIVIFGVMSFFPEVAVQLKKKKKTTTERLRPLNHHKWVSHLLVWIVCNLKIYISKTLSFYIPCVLYTYYKHILPSFSSLDIIIIWVLGTPRRVAVCASPRHSTRDCSLAQYPPLAPRPGWHHHKPKCHKARWGEGVAGEGQWGGRGIWPTFRIWRCLNNVYDDGITARVTFGFLNF